MKPNQKIIGMIALFLAYQPTIYFINERSLSYVLLASPIFHGLI